MICREVLFLVFIFERDGEYLLIDMLIFQVLFDVVPDIKLTEALELVKLQPTGTSAEACRQRFYLCL